MQSLLTLQNEFLNALFQSETQSTTSFIKPNPALAPARQFHIYKNNIFSAHAKALKLIYPVCLCLVGEDFFTQMANIYMGDHASTSPDLNQYGEHLAAFIALYEPANSVPYLSDMARLEWAWHKAYMAADAGTFPFQQFSESYRSEAAEILFLLAPGSTLISSSFPLLPIWEANFKNAATETITLLPDQTFYYFIWRKEYELRIENLAKIDWQILSWIENKTPLHTLCKHAGAFLSSAELEQTIVSLLQHGWINDFCLLT
jgi:hypothetical protein